MPGTRVITTATKLRAKWAGQDGMIVKVLARQCLATVLRGDALGELHRCMHDVVVEVPKSATACEAESGKPAAGSSDAAASSGEPPATSGPPPATGGEPKPKLESVPKWKAGSDVMDLDDSK